MELSYPGVESHGSFSNLGHQRGLLHGSFRNLKAHTLGHCQANWVFQWHIGNWGLIHVGNQGLKAHKLGKDRCIQGVPDISSFPPLTGSPTALWQNYCRGTHL